MDFGKALEKLKAGKKLARKGWNGKEMFIYFVEAAEYKPCSEVAYDYFGGHSVPYREYIAMKTVDEQVVPWVASQTDILAEDWEVVA